MLRNLATLFLLFVLAGIAAEGQQKAEPPKPLPQVQIFGSSDGGYLGVQTQEVTRENFSKYGLSSVRGVAVERVMEDSPAARAGLQAGDVIVRFQGEEVTSTRKLTRLVSEVAPDHEARITVVRGGSEREFTVTMGKRPGFQFENGTFSFPTPPSGEFKLPVPPTAPQIRDLLKEKIFTPGESGTYFFGSSRQIGVTVSTLTKQLGDYFGAPEGKGLLINNVRPDSPAAKAGLKAGDVITEVEGKPVNDMGDLIRGINEKKEGEVTLTIIRDRNRQTVRVTPEKTKSDELFYNFGKEMPLPKITVKTEPAFAPLSVYLNSLQVL